MIIKTVTIFAIQLEIEFWIGQNAQDNTELIEKADDSDLWFHVSDSPSCHVVARIASLSVDKKQLKYIVKQGAVLCKQHTKSVASLKNVAFIYTYVCDVEVTDLPGSVLTKNTKTVVI